MNPERNKNKSKLTPIGLDTYLIEVAGPLSPSWSDYFANMQITTREGPDGSVVTCLTGRVEDQAELLGMLVGLGDLQLPILLVKKVEGQDGL